MIKILWTTCDNYSKPVYDEAGIIVGFKESSEEELSIHFVRDGETLIDVLKELINIIEGKTND